MGRTITTADVKSSSMAKGETLADTARIWSGYADLMVIRHPWEGAARLAAEYSEVPVINAGDGGHEHPTQTLLDLYTLRNEYKTLEGLRIALCGDLKNSRTVHSLIYALVRFGAEIVFVPAQGLELPDHVRHKMETVYDRRIERVAPGSLKALYGDDFGETDSSARVDALYITPSQPHLRAMYEEGAKIEIQLQDGRPLAIYVTRQQVERESDGSGEGGVPRAYPRITASTTSGSEFSKAIIMHPLPRVDELSSDMDSDHRSKYFVQARNGVPVRMALISLVLGLKPWRGGSVAQPLPGDPGQVISQSDNIRCANPNCVTQREAHNARAEFTFFSPAGGPLCLWLLREGSAARLFCPAQRGSLLSHRPIPLPPPGMPPTPCFFTEASEAETLGLRPALIAGQGGTPCS